MEVTNISSAITSFSHMSATKTKLKLALADLTPHYFLAKLLKFGCIPRSEAASSFL